MYIRGIISGSRAWVAHEHVTRAYSRTFLYTTTSTDDEQAYAKMKTAVLLIAAFAVATAFDFPEEWEAWKVVSHTYTPVRACV